VCARVCVCVCVFVRVCVCVCVRNVILMKDLKLKLHLRVNFIRTKYGAADSCDVERAGGLKVSHSNE
jgi:hypothetical protein